MLAKGGRKSQSTPKTVNLPVTRASTVVFENLAELEAIQKRFDADEVVPTYGILNMPLRAAFEELMVEIEGGYRASTFPSGLAANAAALLACVRGGDHVLMVDSVYGPTRRFCDRTLSRLGVETTYYDPLAGEAIAALLKPNTRVVYLESPGSHTFEVQDFPAIARAAKKHGAAVIHDNTWATCSTFLRSSTARISWCRRRPSIRRGTRISSSAPWSRTRNGGRGCATFRATLGRPRAQTMFSSRCAASARSTCA